MLMLANALAYNAYNTLNARKAAVLMENAQRKMNATQTLIQLLKIYVMEFHAHQMKSVRVNPAANMATATQLLLHLSLHLSPNGQLL